MPAKPAAHTHARTLQKYFRLCLFRRLTLKSHNVHLQTLQNPPKSRLSVHPGRFTFNPDRKCNLNLPTLLMATSVLQNSIFSFVFFSPLFLIELINKIAPISTRAGLEPQTPRFQGLGIPGAKWPGQGARSAGGRDETSVTSPATE